MIGTILSAVVPDLVGIFKNKALSEAEAKKAANELVKQWNSDGTKIALVQAEIAKLEATGNWYQRSWRPTIGWVCALAFAWSFLLQPIVSTVLKATGNATELPTLDTGPLMVVMSSMLGLGLYRTGEKMQARMQK